MKQTADIIHINVSISESRYLKKYFAKSSPKIHRNTKL